MEIKTEQEKQFIEKIGKEFLPTLEEELNKVAGVILEKSKGMSNFEATIFASLTVTLTIDWIAAFASMAVKAFARDYNDSMNSFVSEFKNKMEMYLQSQIEESKKN